ncbi:MAG: amidohydrolase family protein, partial [Lacipirellulaceae bacterium]
MNTVGASQQSRLMGSIFAHLLWLVLLPASDVMGSEPERALTAFVGVNVVSMESAAILYDQTVLVEDGHITVVSPRAITEIPPHATVQHADGNYLMPGISDMHAHIFGYNEHDMAGAGSLPENQLLLYVATGVTTLRDANGSPDHFEHRRKIQSGTWLGPDLFFTSPVLEGKDAVWDFSKKIDEPSLAAPLVAEFADSGYWGVKVYHTLRPEVYEAILLAAREYGLPVIGHVPFGVGVESAIAAGQYGIEHLRGYDFDGISTDVLELDGGRSAERFRSWQTMTDARRDELVGMTVEAGVWNAPTLAVNQFLSDADARRELTLHPRYSVVHPTLRAWIADSESYDTLFSDEARQALEDSRPFIQKFVRQLSSAGGNLLVGTDSLLPGYVPGFTPIDEIKAFVEAGLTPFEALRAATSAPAESLG